MDINYTAELKKLLAAEYGCDATDFGIEENVLTTSEERSGGRYCNNVKHFFHMVTMGENAVITADDCLDSFLVRFMRGGLGFKLFELPKLIELEHELNRHGYTLTETYHMFLPGRNVQPEGKFDVRWYTDEEIHRFYGDSRFPNAICPKFMPERPDRIVVCACKGRDILGMAGCSEDAPHWQQIGIDVLPKYRSKGMGTYLVTLLKNRIIENGDIPFYGTSIANYHSMNIAVNSGFRPAWIEIGAKKLDQGDV